MDPLGSTMMSVPVYRRATETLEASVGDELVTLDAETRDCFGFNEAAATVWRILATPKSFEELRDALLAEYDVSLEQCSIDLQALLDDLVEKRLIAPIPSAPSTRD
jgi:hypothetical protein